MAGYPIIFGWEGNIPDRWIVLSSLAAKLSPSMNRSFPSMDRPPWSRSSQSCRPSALRSMLRGPSGSYRTSPFLSSICPSSWQDRLVMSDSLESKKRLDNLAPETSFIAADAIKRAIVEIGESQEAVGQFPPGSVCILGGKGELLTLMVDGICPVIIV